MITRKIVNQAIKHLKSSTVIVGLSALSYLIFSQFVITTYIVDGNSMSPTLYNTEVVFAKKYFHQYERGEVVIIRDPEDNGLSVKRIIGLPNETVTLKDGYVYINTNKLDEPYLVEGTKTFSFKHYTETFVCGDDQYVVLGDNRGESADSRVYGVLNKDNILGFIEHK